MYLFLVFCIIIVIIVSRLKLIYIYIDWGLEVFGGLFRDVNDNNNNDNNKFTVYFLFIISRFDPVLYKENVPDAINPYSQLGMFSFHFE